MKPAAASFERSQRFVFNPFPPSSTGGSDRTCGGFGCPGTAVPTVTATRSVCTHRDQRDRAPSQGLAVYQPQPRYRPRCCRLLPAGLRAVPGSHRARCRCPLGRACGGAERALGARFPLPPPAAPRPNEATFARCGGPAGTVTAAGIGETGRSPRLCHAAPRPPAPSRGASALSARSDTGVPH